MSNTLTDSPAIRNAARAIILQEDRILLLQKFSDEKGEYFALPGGGQQVGESIEEALLRECGEEIGASPSIKQLIHVVEFNKPPLNGQKRQGVDFLFECQLQAHYKPQSGHQPDKRQVGVIWMPMNSINSVQFSPFYLQLNAHKLACNQALILSIVNAIKSRSYATFYLGRFNDEREQD